MTRFRIATIAGVLVCTLSACALSAWAAEPVPLIFDTDMGNDVDDALALAMIHALQSRGEAKLLAVTITKDNRYAAVYCDLVDTFYGRGDVPIGMVRNGKTPEDSAMVRIPAERKKSDGSYVYPRRLKDGAKGADAVAVLRRALAAEKDGSVVIVQVGFSTNLAALLASGPDGASPLPGARLVAQKVRLLSTMAGHFPSGSPEYNVKTDVPAAKKVFTEWPTPVVFSGYEIGQALLFPAARIESDFGWVRDHPVADAYRAYKQMPYDRPTWDLTAVLYGVRPDNAYFSLSPSGRVTVDEKGETHFAADPAGRQRYLILSDAQKARTLETLILLSSEPRSRP